MVSNANDEIRRTISDHPDRFWYFNNGITIVAASIEKTMAGGGERDFGTFRCSDLSVVNGAQTVSTIGKHKLPPGGSLDQLRVPLRVISLQGCPESFGADVTRANNRQNRIENRDFVSQDSVQKEMQRDLAIDGIEYSLMRSETFVPSQNSFDLVEATTSVACASGKSAIVVQLKREIGKLWEDLEKAPYRELFNKHVTGLYVWRCVQVQRVIERMLTDVAKSLAAQGGRPYGIAIHGNRMISLLAFSKISKAVLSNPTNGFNLSSIEGVIEKHTEQAHKALTEAVEQKYPAAILPTLFKNATKCKDLHETALKTVSAPSASSAS